MAKGAEFRIDKQDRIIYFSLVKRPRLLRVVIATCALSLFSTANPANANGSLDTSFDTDGKVTTAIGSSRDAAQSVAIQSDGKIVAAGYSNNGSNYEFALARYNTDGSLDTSFDTDGKVTTAIGSSNDYAQSVAIQSDGKIVEEGIATFGSSIDFSLSLCY